MLTILPGLEERVMTVVTPAEVARRAATILVDMPPVPRRDPALDTEFFCQLIVLFLFFPNKKRDAMQSMGTQTIGLQSSNIFHNFNRLSIRICARILVI